MSPRPTGQMIPLSNMTKEKNSRCVETGLETGFETGFETGQGGLSFFGTGFVALRLQGFGDWTYWSNKTQ